MYIGFHRNRTAYCWLEHAVDRAKHGIAKVEYNRSSRKIYSWEFRVNGAETELFWPLIFSILCHDPQGDKVFTFLTSEDNLQLEQSRAKTSSRSFVFRAPSLSLVHSPRSLQSVGKLTPRCCLAEHWSCWTDRTGGVLPGRSWSRRTTDVGLGFYPSTAASECIYKRQQHVGCATPVI